jgi:ADP-ribose pyrophosphatase YjhB (NUDIX family)
MFKYCPSCASESIRFEQNKKFVCPECGFTYYHNTAAATACLIRTGPADPASPGGIAPGEEALVFLVRGKEPAKGKLDLPGGFVDPGEGALDGLYRECREELGWEAPEGGFSLLASFPNVYPYKGVVYNTCDLFFILSAPGLTEKDFRLEESEVSGVRFLKLAEIDFDKIAGEIAFDSARRAVRVYLDSRG